MRSSLAAAIVAILCAVPSQAADVSLIAPGGIRAATQKLVPAFERASGHRVAMTFGSGGGTKQRVIDGEAFDLVIVQPPLEKVVASGAVVAASRAPLAKVWVGLAAKAGAPKPDISTADAVRKLLLGARAIAFPDAANGAAAGVSFNATLKTLGIAEQIAPKIKISRGGAMAMAMLTKGEVDVALTFISEIITEPGVEVVGPLPADISEPTRFVAFVSARSREPDATKALVAWLSSSQAAAAYTSSGMEAGE